MSEALTLADLAARPVTDLEKVTPARAAALAKLDPPIETVLDVLTTYPRRYLDRTRQATISELRDGEEATLLVRVDRIEAPPVRKRGGVSRVVVTVGDGTGRLPLVFFRQPWRAKTLRVGEEVAVFGKVELYRGRHQMTHPVLDKVGDQVGRIIPIYAQSEKHRVASDDVAAAVRQTLRKCRARTIADPLDPALRDELGLVDRWTAFGWIHEPESFAERDRAKQRLVFDELLRVQLALVLRKRAWERAAVGIRHTVAGDLVTRFWASLPFELTPHQDKAIGEIAADLAGSLPMHRLLQGDVGSGKTIVAVTAMLMAVQGGHQAALMAPTEVLAEQHFLTVRELLAGLTIDDAEGASLFTEREVRVGLLTNRTTAAERRDLLAGLADGTVDLLIGTHALLEESVEMRSLGVVVIDEQHRFGVEQRAALRDKGSGSVPDVLVMTATPIPRTAAMTVYGDLDVTEITGLPPGRTPVETRWARTADDEAAVWQAVRDEVAAGRQAYVVCPLIDESDKLEAAAATDVFARLDGGELAGLRLALLHGRMPSKEKEATMAAFRTGGFDVLVSTTVIEVGVDVPNATVMVILDADRFGLAQLHQLRGRVGRAEHASRCFLLGEGTTEKAEERLLGFENEHSGFELAKLDLELRGEGTIMGKVQKGRSDLRLANLRRDEATVVRAREVAFRLVDASPGLADNPGLRDEIRQFIDPEEEEFLFRG